MSTEILKSGCAVAEFRGTSGTPYDTLKRYCESLNGGIKINKNLGSTNAHVFVIMSGTDSKGTELKSYIEKNKLGEVRVLSGYKNTNHFGWFSDHQYPSTTWALLWAPDFKKLVKWAKTNVREDYEINEHETNIWKS